MSRTQTLPASRSAPRVPFPCMPPLAPDRARPHPWLLAYWLACALWLGACASTTPDTSRDAPARVRAPQGPIVAVEDRVDHVMGTTLVMPVTVAPELATPGPIEAVLEDGRDVGARLVWFDVTADPDEHARWLPPAGLWKAIEHPDGAHGAGPGFWAVVTSLPLDAAGQGLWIQRGLLEINWLGVPLVDDGHPALAPVRPQALASPGYAAFVGPERQSPLRRWRARLATEGIASSLPALLSDPGEGDRAQDPVESLAFQQEARWALALLRLYADDPDVCENLRRALCAHAAFENGIWAPAWALDQNALERLLQDLLRPSSAASARLRAARFFMDDQPPAIAWVIDDAGLIDAASGAALASFGVVNLTDRATLAWAAPARSASDAPTLQPIPPGTGVTLKSVSSAIADGTGAVSINVGRWSVERRVLSEPLTVVPPGSRMGPFLPGWTLESWQSGRDPSPLPADVAWTTAALLERLPGADGDWTIYVECMRPPDAGNDADTVRIWMGPRARPSAVLRITRDGSATNELAVQGQDVLVEHVRVADDRWSFRVRLPRNAVDAEGVLTLGMERLGSRARRWSWPRAMTPWQVEPGRVRFALDRWD